MVLLACPRKENRATGGFAYNREITGRIGPEKLRYVLTGASDGTSPTGEQIIPGGVDLAVLDSLFFLDPEAGFELLRETGSPYGLLIHYLPSSDPTGTDAERSALADKENSLLTGAVGAVVTGTSTAEELRRRRPDLRIASVLPGAPLLRGGGNPATGAAGERDGIHFVTVANLTPLKGIAPLVSVFADLGSRAWRWTIYGDTGADPAYTREVLEAISGAGLDDGIRLAGPIEPEEIEGVLGSADAFVFPSLSESYGMAAAEALAAGLPVVLNDTGEISRIIENGREGFVCPSRGKDLDREAWKISLSRIISDGALRGRMASAAAVRASMLPGWDDAARDFWEAVRSWTT